MPIVSLPGGELRDEIRQTLYDTVTLKDGDTLAATRRFFASVTDSSNQPKSLLKTNMRQPGSLETAVSFRTQGISLDAQNSLADNQNILPILLQKSALVFKVGVKDYWTGPARFAAGRMLESGIAGTDLADGRVFQQFGWPAVQPIIFQGRHVVDINPLQNFELTWIIEDRDLTAAEKAIQIASGTEINVVASLKGLLRRPVQ